MEEARGWEKAEPLSEGAEGLEMDLDRAACAEGGEAVPRPQAEGGRSREVVVVRRLESGLERGVDAGMEGAAGALGVQMLLLKDEAGVGAQFWGVGSLWLSQEESGAVVEGL